jgi:uncharacterized protein (DUF697 family)
MKVLKKGPIGAVGTVRSFMNVVKDIDFEEVRDRAERIPRMLVLATSQDLAEQATSRLFGAVDRNGISTESWDDRESLDATRYDVVIVFDPHGEGLFDRVRRAVGSRRDATNVFFLAKEISDGDDPAAALRAEVMDTLPDLAPSFGRHFGEWQPAAVRAIIEQTSRANAQFALVSNIPAVIPILGGLVAASADLIVLTKNQIMMAYKIAAAHDRDLDDQMAIVRELTPVVGAGFLWRTAAREAASFIPLAAGTIPKVAIAFVGTMTVGRAADYYYRFGKKPPKSQLLQFRQQAEALLDRLPFVGDDDASGKQATSSGDEAIKALEDTQPLNDTGETQRIDSAG